MKSWNPFGRVDMEIGSFLKESIFNKDYEFDSNENDKGNVNKGDKNKIK